ncbi:imidazole glycerol phosphate synthase subunit HisH [Polynucleobacter paneuropaeus]|nr:imidazole glycerol phosphate synthase subunit HisH [Polynucleobacter paneuropaeus]
MKKIAILNYGLGNVRSVSNALRAIGSDAIVTRDKNEIIKAGGLIIPGVGAFPHGMSNLRELDLIETIYRFIDSGRPVLGICLGMQLLFDRGAEHQPTDGLELIPGSVERIPIKSIEGRLPHIAWSKIQPSELARHTMFAGITDEEMRFYFVHSYAAVEVTPQYLAATVDYMGHHMTAAVKKNNIWGMQFHPEKSGSSGLKVLKNFAIESAGGWREIAVNCR